MLKSVAFANALTAVTAVFYVVCFLLSAIAPDLVIGIANSWVHAISLEAVKSTGAPALTTAIWGLVTIAAVAWVTTYATIELYNRLAKS